MNRSLTAEIEALRDGANAAMVRLQLFIEWWAEYHSNHDDVVTWMEEAESRLEQLDARAGSTQGPLVSPIELLMDAKVSAVARGLSVSVELSQLYNCASSIL